MRVARSLRMLEAFVHQPIDQAGGSLYDEEKAVISQDPLSRLARELGERLQGASQAPEEIHKGVQQAVRSACERLELVSREDFDILMDVLQRTRSRVEALEARVAVLEEAAAEPKARGEGDENTP